MSCCVRDKGIFAKREKSGRAQSVQNINKAVIMIEANQESKNNRAIDPHVLDEAI